MRLHAGQPHKNEWQVIANYVETYWPEMRQESVSQTIIWLLEHLRRIEESGVLPGISNSGALVYGVTLPQTKNTETRIMRTSRAGRKAAKHVETTPSHD